MKWASDGIAWTVELPTNKGKIICTVRSKSNPRGFSGLVEYVEGAVRQEIAVYDHIDDLDTARAKCEERATTCKETLDHAEPAKEEPE